MRKEIDQDVEALRKEIENDRKYLGPYPLKEDDVAKWKKIYECNKDLAQSINTKINTYNLIVPLMNKQKFHVEFDKICDEILKNGLHSVTKENKKVDKVSSEVKNDHEDFFSVFFKAVGDLWTFNNEKKKY